MKENYLDILESRLKKISGSYKGFVLAMTATKFCTEKYAKDMLDYLDNHPNATTSEIIDYQCDYIGIPWCDDDGVWHRWDKIITEEEAIKITNEEYNDG